MLFDLALLIGQHELEWTKMPIVRMHRPKIQYFPISEILGVVEGYKICVHHFEFRIWLPLERTREHTHKYW